MNLQEYLCCSVCKGDLRDNISHLYCHGCGAKFFVKEGVPVFLDYERLHQHSKNQIVYFEKEKITASEVYELEPWQQRYVARFLDNVPSVRGKLVVDCGTGSGHMAIELAKQGANVIATDLTLRNVIRLMRIAEHLNLHHKVLGVCSPAEALPIRTDCVTSFISNACLEHVMEEALAISETDRVAHAGASLMLTVPLAYKYINPLLMPLNWIHDKKIGHLRRYCKESIDVKFCGWKVRKTYYTGHMRKVIKMIINMVVPVFDLNRIEEEDSYLTNKKWSASNIICFLTKDNG